MDVEGNSWDFPADVLVEILLRLPPSARRRARFVCRLWRDAVDGTSEMRRPAKTLVCVKKFTWTGMRTTASAVYVVDDLPAGRFREVWTGGGGVSVVGTCNGLLCLFDDGQDAITLANPVTGETLAVPPLPRSGKLATMTTWSEAYSFGYHPTTGRYKIVHVPCYLNPAAAGRFDAVQVFTLGEASSSSWRDVPLPGPAAASCRLGAGIVSVDGATHWLTNDAGKVMSFDLRDERLTAKPLPAVPRRRSFNFRLMVARGRLAFAVDIAELALIKTKVWVLERGRWRHRYDVEVSGQGQRLTAPHFTDGEHVLTRDDGLMSHSPAPISSAVYGYRVSDGRRRRDARRRLVLCSVVRINGGERPAAAAAGGIEGNIDRTFAYVETTEPLSIYRCGD